MSTDHLAVNQAAIDNTLAVKREPIAALNFSNAEPQLRRIVASLTEASTEGGHRYVLPAAMAACPNYRRWRLAPTRAVCHTCNKTKSPRMVARTFCPGHILMARKLKHSGWAASGGNSKPHGSVG